MLDALPADHPGRVDVDEVPGGDLTTVGWRALAVLGSSAPTPLGPALEARYAELLTDRVATVGIEQADATRLAAARASHNAPVEEYNAATSDVRTRMTAS